MSRSNCLLVAIHSIEDGEIVLAKAGTIAAALGASLHLLQAVYDTFADLSLHEVETSEGLKGAVLRDAEAKVLEMIAAWRAATHSKVPVSLSVVWEKRDWHAVLETAQALDTDLIIKSMAPSSMASSSMAPSSMAPSSMAPLSHSFIRTPSDWHLLRHSHCPVMLVTPINWTQRPNIIAAVDANIETPNALNDLILHQAQQYTQLLHGTLHVVSAFPSVERWLGPISVAIDFNKVRDNVQHQTDQILQEMTDRLGLPDAQFHSQEGEPAEVIQRLCQSLDAQLLVVGTAQNTGAKLMLLSNTAEQILQQVRCDVLVVINAPESALESTQASII